MDRLNVDPVLALVAVARSCKIDRTTLSDQSWYSSEYRDWLPIVIKDSAPLKRVLPDGPGEWYVDGEEVCLMYCKKFKSRDLTQENPESGKVALRVQQ